MKQIVLTALVLVLCTSCASRVSEPSSGLEITDVKCLIRSEHQGKYTAWSLNLIRVTKGREDPEMSVGEMTSVGSEPESLAGYYKTTELGEVYVVIDELHLVCRMRIDGSIDMAVWKPDYYGIPGEQKLLEFVRGYSIEVQRRQFPLLTPNPE